MDDWSYKNILNKIKKIENAMERLELDGFMINKNELNEIIVVNKIFDEGITLDYLKIHNELNDLLNRLHKLEKFENYYSLIKFKLANDKNVGLFLDAYVNDTLDILKPLNTEIKEHGYTNLNKFVIKFYDLVYFLIKLEIGVNGESEIYKEMYNHKEHVYYLRETAMSDLNRIRMNNEDKQELRNEISEKTYDGFVNVIIRLLPSDKKTRKLLNLSNKSGETKQVFLSKKKRLIKKND